LTFSNYKVKKNITFKDQAGNFNIQTISIHNKMFIPFNDLFCQLWIFTLDSQKIEVRFSSILLSA